jgi:hypothetical protein
LWSTRQRRVFHGDKALTPRVVSYVFEERKGEQHKVVSFASAG